MVLKSLSRKSGTKQLISYLFEKERGNVKEVMFPLVIRHNVRSRSLLKWVKEFEDNEKLRVRKRKNNVKLYHTVLSFSHLDKKHVNEKVLRDIARKYISLRGRDNMYLGTAHYDKDHIHLHLVISGTKYLTGESNRISRKDFHNIKLALDDYQRKKYPELIHSLPKHGKSLNMQLVQQEQNTSVCNNRMSQKQSLLQVLKNSYVRAKSIDEFLSSLQANGHVPYYRSGKLTGIHYEGNRKFRLSRLGYDAKKIEALNHHHTKEIQVLSEIREVRKKHSLKNEREKIGDNSKRRKYDNNKGDVER